MCVLITFRSPLHQEPAIRWVIGRRRELFCLCFLATDDHRCFLKVPSNYLCVSHHVLSVADLVQVRRQIVDAGCDYSSKTSTIILLQSPMKFMNEETIILNI